VAPPIVPEAVRADAPREECDADADVDAGTALEDEMEPEDGADAPAVSLGASLLNLI